MAAKPRVLIVDDEEPNRLVLREMIEILGYDAEIARDGMDALAIVKLDIDLVLLDVNMPGMDGFEVARRIRQDPEVADLPIIQVTALTSHQDRLRAVEAGANDFIGKPVDSTELRVRCASLLKMKQQQDAIKAHQAELENTVERRTSALRLALSQRAEAERRAYQAHLDTIHRLAIAAEYKDEDTASHIHRMSRYCGVLAEAIHLQPGEIESLVHASPMHDVGKMGIPDGILLKPGKLEPDEWEVMKTHTTIGGRILGGSDSELLEAGKVIALSHHERWDGSGYPAGIGGEDIPLSGRIAAVADVFDALTTKRPYKVAMPNEEAFEIIRKGRGSHFDAELVDHFFGNLDQILAVQKQYRDQTEDNELVDDQLV